MSMPRTTIQFERRQLRALSNLSWQTRRSVSHLVREGVELLLEQTEAQDAAAVSMIAGRIEPREESALVAG